MWLLLLLACPALVLTRPLDQLDDGEVYVTTVNNTSVCVVDGRVYEDGERLPAADPCEVCRCRPPGFACTLIRCGKRVERPGCALVKIPGICCPQYQCNDTDSNLIVERSGNASSTSAPEATTVLAIAELSSPAAEAIGKSPENISIAEISSPIADVSPKSPEPAKQPEEISPKAPEIVSAQPIENKTAEEDSSIESNESKSEENEIVSAAPITPQNLALPENIGGRDGNEISSSEAPLGRDSSVLTSEASQLNERDATDEKTVTIPSKIAEANTELPVLEERKEPAASTDLPDGKSSEEDLAEKSVATDASILEGRQPEQTEAAQPLEAKNPEQTSAPELEARNPDSATEASLLAERSPEDATSILLEGRESATEAPLEQRNAESTQAPELEGRNPENTVAPELDAENPQNSPEPLEGRSPASTPIAELEERNEANTIGLDARNSENTEAAILEGRDSSAITEAALDGRNAIDDSATVLAELQERDSSDAPLEGRNEANTQASNLQERNAEESTSAPISLEGRNPEASTVALEGRNPEAATTAEDLQGRNSEANTDANLLNERNAEANTIVPELESRNAEASTVANEIKGRAPEEIKTATSAESEESAESNEQTVTQALRSRNDVQQITEATEKEEVIDARNGNNEKAYGGTDSGSVPEKSDREGELESTEGVIVAEVSDKSSEEQTSLNSTSGEDNSEEKISNSSISGRNSIESNPALQARDESSTLADLEGRSAEISSASPVVSRRKRNSGTPAPQNKEENSLRKRRQSGQGFFNNASKKGGVKENGMPLSEGERERLKETIAHEFQNLFNRGGNRGRPMLNKLSPRNQLESSSPSPDASSSEENSESEESNEIQRVATEAWTTRSS